MSQLVSRVFVLGCVLLCGLGSTACSSFAPGEIPNGRWVGQGRYVEHVPASDKDYGDSATESQVKPYRTSLDIRRIMIQDQEHILIEIVSQRGELRLIEGDKTHLRVAMRYVSQAGEGVSTYQVVAMQMNPQPEAAIEQEHEPNSPVLAFATETSNGTQLHLWYTEFWHDVLILGRDKVVKTGSALRYPDEEENEEANEIPPPQIHWYEELHRE